MFNFFSNFSFIMQALIATIFTWLVTALGAAAVFIFKKINKTVLDTMLGLSAGIMIAASFWSLLKPALEMTDTAMIIILGFMCGGLLLFVGDKVFSYISKKKSISNNKFRRCFLLMSSITLHNIPEGMVIGVAFGSLAYGIEGTTLASAIALAIGIGLQNFPEGSAISLPLRREGLSRFKSFFYGQLSGFVEPISAVLGAILVLKIRLILPFLLASAAGAMIYVVVEELIPESQTNSKKELITIFTLIGFSIMTFLVITLS